MLWKTGDGTDEKIRCILYRYWYYRYTGGHRSCNDFHASAVAAAENTGRNPRRILQLHFNSIRFSVCHVCLQPVLRSVGSNRKQLYAACFPDYFIVGKHCTGFAVYPFFRHGCSRCCNCNRDCAGNFRRALPDLYCYQSKNSASGKTSF